MSAFVLPESHIELMVAAALHWGEQARRIGGLLVRSENADAVGQMLLAENVASVAYRYPECPRDALPGPLPTPDPAAYRHVFRLAPFAVPPVAVLKALDAYEYQACEHPGWTSSLARRFCDGLRKLAITQLDGYDEAPWVQDAA